MKQSHKILVGTALGVGLLGLGGAAIAAPLSGNDPTPAVSATAQPTSTTSPEELKKLYDPIISAQENVVKEIQNSIDKATGSEKDHLTRMKQRAEQHLQRLKDVAAGKIGQHDGKGRGEHGMRGGKGHHGMRDGRGPGGGASAQPTATPSK